MKDSTKTIILIISFILMFIGFLFYGSYRNQQIEEGKIKVVYQYGGDI